MVQAILLDIEGTTTPIDFVHKTLFPYARARMAGFVQQNLAELKFEISQLEGEASNDGEYKNELRTDSANSVADYLIYLVDNDRKSTPLKSIQGTIWQAGYENGDLVSTVYDDVPKAFERWKGDGKTIAIYSSGSVLAQQLIFKYSDHGDLTRFIDRYFDTNIGHKREPDSYTKIAAELELAAAEILFVSDISAELDAAAASGYQTALAIRQGTEKEEATSSHISVASFDTFA
jgi:enolase-phosphatase E1